MLKTFPQEQFVLKYILSFGFVIVCWISVISSLLNRSLISSENSNESSRFCLLEIIKLTQRSVSIMSLSGLFFSIALGSYLFNNFGNFFYFFLFLQQFW